MVTGFSWTMISCSTAVMTTLAFSGINTHGNRWLAWSSFLGTEASLLIATAWHTRHWCITAHAPITLVGIGHGTPGTTVSLHSNFFSSFSSNCFLFAFGFDCRCYICCLKHSPQVWWRNVRYDSACAPVNSYVNKIIKSSLIMPAKI